MEHRNRCDARSLAFELGTPGVSVRLINHTGDRAMQEQQGTQINASGDHIRIINGDAVQRQQVGVQHIAAMYVARAPRGNGARRQAVTRAGRLRLVAAIAMTVLGAFMWHWSNSFPTTNLFPQLQASMQEWLRIVALVAVPSVWAIYAYHRWRNG